MLQCSSPESAIAKVLSKGAEQQKLRCKHRGVQVPRRVRAAAPLRGQPDEPEPDSSSSGLAPQGSQCLHGIRAVGSSERFRLFHSAASLEAPVAANATMSRAGVPEALATEPSVASFREPSAPCRSLEGGQLCKKCLWEKSYTFATKRGQVRATEIVSFSSSGIVFLTGDYPSPRSTSATSTMSGRLKAFQETKPIDEHAGDSTAPRPRHEAAQALPGQRCANWQLCCHRLRSSPEAEATHARIARPL